MLRLLALEDRIMLDGAPLEAAPDAEPVAEPGPEVAPEADAPPVAEAPDASDAGGEVAFVDARLEDSGSLVAQLQARGVEVHTIAADQDGVAAVGAALAGRQDVSAVHLLSHGDEGLIVLGDSVLQAGYLDGHADDLAAWGDALSAEADLLLYGCDVADGAGAALLAELSALTGADVAGSVDATGGVAGDWDLEATSGAIEAAAFSLWASQELATFTVDSLDDTVAADGVTTLREAVAAANGSGGDDLIVFDAALAGGTITLTGGELDVTDALEVRGLGAGSLTIDGNDASRIFDATANLTVSGLTLQDGNVTGSGGAINATGGATVSVSSVTFSGNDATEDGGAIASETGAITVTSSTFTSNTSGDDGGAVYTNTGGVTVTGSTFTSNVSSDDGGGINAEDSAISVTGSTFTTNRASDDGGALGGRDGAITVVRSTFTGNRAAEDGGAIDADAGAVTVTSSTFTSNVAYNDGGAIYTVDGTITVNSSTFTSNTARDNGGAIESEDGAVVVNSSTFTSNTARFGGGALNTEDGSITVTSSTLTGNTATFGEGGAIAADGGDVSVTLSTISGNTSSYDGGGIYLYNGSLTLDRSTVADNRARGGEGEANGGGIGARDARVTITASTVSGNTAGRSGGGLYVSGYAPTITSSTFSGNTITDNRESEGGSAIHVNTEGTARISSSTIVENTGRTGAVTMRGGAGLELVNSIVALNEASDEGNADLRLSGRASIQTSLIQTDRATLIGEEGTFTEIGTNLFGLDPQLGALANNGGPTQTHLPQAGSPVLNVASNLGLTSDQRGLSRLQGSGVDIGAVEVQLETTSEGGGSGDLVHIPFEIDDRELQELLVEVLEWLQDRDPAGFPFAGRSLLPEIIQTTSAQGLRVSLEAELASRLGV